MKRAEPRRASVIGVACGAMLFWTQADAQDVLLDVVVKDGPFIIVSKTQVTVPFDKEIEVQAGARYKLKILPTLMATLERVRFSVLIDDSKVQHPMKVLTNAKFGEPARLLNGRKGDQEIQITATPK